MVAESCTQLCSGERSSRIWDVLEAKPRVTGCADAGVTAGVLRIIHPVRSSVPYSSCFTCICVLSLPYSDLGCFLCRGSGVYDFLSCGEVRRGGWCWTCRAIVILLLVATDKSHPRATSLSLKSSAHCTGHSRRPWPRRNCKSNAPRSRGFESGP